MASSGAGHFRSQAMARNQVLREQALGDDSASDMDVEAEDEVELLANLDITQRRRATARASNAAVTVRNHKRKLKEMNRYFNAEYRRLNKPERELYVGDKLQYVPSAAMFLNFLQYKKEAKFDITERYLASYRSAIGYFISRRDLATREARSTRWRAQDYTEIKEFLVGVKKLRAEMIRQGDISGDVGKRHLQVCEYKTLAFQALTTCGTLDSMVRMRAPMSLYTYMVLAWNLCARCDTASNIHVSHIKWDGDAMAVGINKSKMQNKVELEYFLVYANPEDPTICPVTATAIHLCCAAQVLTGKGRMLFPANDASSTLSAELGELLQKLGFEQVGSHSWRKGPLTLVCTGVADSAALMSVFIRARWMVKQFGVQLTYIHHGIEGDAYIGRLLSLLDPKKEIFHALPPHFHATTAEEREIVSCNVRSLFGTMNELPGPRLASPFWLASLIHHLPKLKTLLPTDHDLWRTPLGSMPPTTVDRLRSMLCTDGDCSSFEKRGIQTASLNLKETRALAQQVEVNKTEAAQQLAAGLDTLRHELVDVKNMVTNLVEIQPIESMNMNHSVGRQRTVDLAGMISDHLQAPMQQMINDTLAPIVEETKALKDLVQLQQVQAQPVAPQPQDQVRSSFTMYQWSDGSMKFVPELWEFSRNSKLYAAWREWFGGVSPDNGTMPLRTALLGPNADSYVKVLKLSSENKRCADHEALATRLEIEVKEARTAAAARAAAAPAGAEVKQEVVPEVPASKKITEANKARWRNTARRDVTNAVREWKRSMEFLQELGRRHPRFGDDRYRMLQEVMPQRTTQERGQALVLAEALWEAAIELAEGALKNPLWFKKQREHDVDNWSMRTIDEHVMRRKKYLDAHPEQVDDILEHEVAPAVAGDAQAPEQPAANGANNAVGGDVDMPQAL